MQLNGNAIIVAVGREFGFPLAAGAGNGVFVFVALGYFDRDGPARAAARLRGKKARDVGVGRAFIDLAVGFRVADFNQTWLAALKVMVDPEHDRARIGHADTAPALRTAFKQRVIVFFFTAG